MAESYTPGFTGYRYGRFSSSNQKAIGKFTAANHLHTLSQTHPDSYDKKYIDIYSQSGIISNDFMSLINKAEPYYCNTGSWEWYIETPFTYTKVVDVPSTTLNKVKPGIDNEPIHLVFDTPEFGANEIIAIGHRTHGPQFHVNRDPVPQGDGYLYELTYSAENPQSDFVDKRWLQTGMDVISITSVIGEFTQTRPGLGKFADKVKMFESTSSAVGRQHTITKDADIILLDGRDVSSDMGRDSSGNLLDLIAFAPEIRNSTKKLGPSSIRWEPYVETLLKKKTISDAAGRMLWAKSGRFRDAGERGHWKTVSDGVIPRIRKHGNYVPYNKGEFATLLLREAIGDLFYGRVPMTERRLKLYTNEAGFDTWDSALKSDFLNSALTPIVDVPALRSKGITISDPSQHLVYGWAFDSMFTRDTGLIEVVHLSELEDRQLNAEFGQNKKAAPLFLAFDISNQAKGNYNIRPVRRKGAPSMSFGYVDGTQHHLGHAASQGMSSANLQRGYSIWAEDYIDVFIEDCSKCFLMEEKPQF